MKIEFCPELQLDWSIQKIDFESMEEIKISLVVSKGEPYPDSQDRHGKDVLSWPTIYTETAQADFFFSSCVYFNIRDEIAPGISEGDVGEGKSFQRFLSSELLTKHSDRGIDNLYHYRIVTPDEVIDVLCNKTPDIVKRNFT